MGHFHKGTKINKLLNLGAIEAKFSEDGIWFHHLNNFPGALIDKKGYALFNTESSYSFLRNTKDLNIKDGIEKLKQYKYFGAEQLKVLEINGLITDLISTLDELLNNLETIENYITAFDADKRIKISQYIKRGTCFVAYQINNEIRFAPSKFTGYKNNSLEKHIPSLTDGRDTNKVISQILNSSPQTDDNLEIAYQKYCDGIGVEANKTGGYGAPRKYWTLLLKKDFQNNEFLSGEFPEGKVIERIHKARERSSKVVLLAKDNFKKEHGRLFCQICKFDFEKIYGELGKDFIEGHHTVSLSDMKENHYTKPEDIAMLCSNCHRMVHKRRPWLSMNDLEGLLEV